jgi:uncharacterized membrane protein HdeD (DUF308 family)
VDANIANRETNEQHRGLGWHIALAIVMMVLGVLAILAPYVATFALVQIAGIAFTAGGLILAIQAFKWGISERFFFSFILGLVYFAFGIYLLAHPLSGAVALTVAIALFFMAVGVIKIINAFRIRPASSWGWMLFSGLVSLFLSAVIWAGMPLTALWAVGLIVGIDLLFYGLSLLMILLSLRSAGIKRRFCIGGECYSLP